VQSPEPYLGLTVHLVLCVALGAGLIVAAKILRYRAVGGSASRHDTYECGEEPIGPAWQRVSVGFYLIALVFILFDAEAAFLFPWVQSLRSSGPPAFWGMVAFVAVLFVGWVYAWRKGDLDWSR
jgi:NADH:ubiquinone oxidoreductase subunit 3 (subunit A)